MRRDIGDRLKRARRTRGRSQRGFAGDIGMPLPSYRDYEGGKRIPGGEALRRFAEAGLDTHWLLTGDNRANGDVAAIRDTRGDYRADGRGETFDLAAGRLREIITALETGLEETGRRLPPAGKAELIVALYELCAESGKPPSAAAVRRLLNISK